MKIENAIQQKTFKNEYLKAHINILYSSSWFRYQIHHLLEPFQISLQQFNILRILRGKHPEPLTGKELTKKMIDRMSNTSRLVEKMKQKELVTRTRAESDRRRVDITITQKGLALLEETSIVMEREIVNSMQNISEEEARLLTELLDKMRG